LTPHRHRQSARGNVGASDEPRVRRSDLPVRQVDQRIEITTPTAHRIVLDDVRRYANDGEPLAGSAALDQTHRLSQRVVSGPLAIGKLLIDDGDARRRVSILLSELATGNQRGPEGDEVVSTNHNAARLRTPIGIDRGL